MNPLKEITDQYFAAIENQKGLVTNVENATSNLKAFQEAFDQAEEAKTNGETNIAELEAKIKGWVDPE